MDWILQERAQGPGLKPVRTTMQSVWDRARTENPTDESLDGPHDPQKAIDDFAGLVRRH